MYVYIAFEAPEARAELPACLFELVQWRVCNMYVLPMCMHICVYRIKLSGCGLNADVN